MFGDTKSITEIAETLTQTLERQFVYDARSITELEAALKQAGFEPIYAASVIEEVKGVADETILPYREGFDTIERITGKPATTWIDFPLKYPQLFAVHSTV